MTFYGTVHSNIFPENTSPVEGKEAVSPLKGSLTQSVMSKCRTIRPFCFTSLAGTRETFRAAESASYSLDLVPTGTSPSDSGSEPPPRGVTSLTRVSARKCHRSSDCSHQALSLLLTTNTASATVLWHSR